MKGALIVGTVVAVTAVSVYAIMQHGQKVEPQGEGESRISYNDGGVPVLDSDSENGISQEDFNILIEYSKGGAERTLELSEKVDKWRKRTDELKRETEIRLERSRDLEERMGALGVQAETARAKGMREREETLRDLETYVRNNKGGILTTEDLERHGLLETKVDNNSGGVPLSNINLKVT